MFHTIFTKTLYEKRWFTLGWSVAIFLMVIFIMILFPTFKESFGTALKDVPESMQAFLGSAEDYQTITRYVDLQVVAQMVIMTIILAIILFTSLLAGDESTGTLQSLLYQPVPRWRVYIEKLYAGAVITAVASLALSLGVAIGALLIHEPIDMMRLIQTTIAIWLITMVFGAFTYCVGAATGKRGLTGATAGITTFVLYLITSLAATADSLNKLNYVSPFRYFNSPSVLENGLSVGHTLVLTTLVLLFAAIGYVLFMRRDIHQP